MDKYSLGALIVAALIALAWWGMYRSWKRRTLSSATVRPTHTTSGVSQAEAISFPVLYVATTPKENPLQRLNLPGLAFRAKATVWVFPDLIEISPAGEESTTISPASFLGVRTARVAIDRAVEKDGLTALDWVATDMTTGERRLVTSFFRIPNIQLRERFDASLEAFNATHIATVKEVAS